MSNFSIIMLGLLGLSFIASYILGPILVHAKTRQPSNRTFTELPANFPLMKLPPGFPQRLWELQCLGFSLVGHLTTSQDFANLRMIVSLLVNRDTNTMATVIWMIASTSVSTQRMDCLEFITDFDDGLQIDTINSPTVAIHRRHPQKLVARVPHLRNASSLLNVHQHLVAKQNGRRPIIPAQGAEFDHFRAGVEKSLVQQAELGYYFFDESTKDYRLTWPAAISSAWSLLWPAKQILQFKQARAGRQLAQAAGVGGR